MSTNKSVNKRGILIFAVGHPYYGRMAYNLVMTIKQVEDIHVTVVKSAKSLSHLSTSQLEIFDNVIEAPLDLPKNCGAKLWADDVSPYEKTLVLDADMLWLPKRKPSELFEELKDCSFTAITEGYWPDEIHPKYRFWANPDEIKEKYQLKSDKIYQWRSEVMYVTPDASEMLTLAQQIFMKPNLSSEKMFANGTADELGLMIACAIKDIHPHQYRWKPSYWHLMNGGAIPSELGNMYERYYLVSFGANHASQNSKKLYDRLVKAACYNRGTSHVFPLISKKEFLPERQKN